MGGHDVVDKMISIDAAAALARDSLPGKVKAEEWIGILGAPGRVLSRDLSSDMDMPPFDKSAMDGFACRRADLGSELLVVETVAAGRVPQKAIGPGECARIMTGAAIPVGADLVFKVEDSVLCGPERVRFAGSENPYHICRRGEDVRCGDLVLQAGTLLDIKHVAVLASIGAHQVAVAARPRVGILATGDELVDPDTIPGPGQIRNSNAWQLAAQVHRAGGVPIMLGTASDTYEALTENLQSARAQCDMVLLTGGVSMGDFDLVPKVLSSLGASLLFESVAIKPGKPTTFALWGEMPVWCLPGNPVSTFVVFEMFVRRYILGWMGCRNHPADPELVLETEVVRRKGDRLEWIPVRLTGGGGVEPVDYHGSAHFFAIGWAEGLITLPKGVTHLERGSRVAVRQI